ncbi:NAD-dependent epimerase [Psychrobacter sp. Choline-02u-13]|uniref:D-erythronate dehydrogenase n=1 Tax=unclassified Psychrobacter TaxID=196806 RepID=UPI000C7C76E6|nr:MULTISPECIES: D-erythronate dehydrogenase [unclassified Psychrobacter]PKG63586.1 NAD-dependent epimerase [Psychrobacter sp. Choline-02u-13]PKH53174.1 NAD-dependent epimerase [Psychrobacter sp. Choline-02u-9]
MNILITGGTGFVGKEIAKTLLKTGSLTLKNGETHKISKVILFDCFAGEGVPTDDRVEVVLGDINDKSLLQELIQDVDIIWHLAAVVSSAAEEDFELGMSINLYGLINLLEILRLNTSSKPVKFIYASGCAVFGGKLPDVVTDTTAVTPSSSYGMQKAVGELLVCDYSRKGYIDGRVLRLPTIVVRPGKPNRAASTFFSSIIREPLNNEKAICPVNRETQVFIMSPRQCISSMLLAAQISHEDLGNERIISLPGLTVSVNKMLEALEKIAGKERLNLIEWQHDANIEKIVKSWPIQIEAAYAKSLGFEADKSFEDIIRAHIEDNPTALA